MSKFMSLLRLTLLVSMAWILPISAADEMYLKDNLIRAQKGDFIVTSSNKNYTLLHIYDKTDTNLIMEEITVPESKINLQKTTWAEWVQNGAPFHTSWVMYEIDLSSGQMLEFFSFTKNGWMDLAKADNFLSSLLNLRLYKVSESNRKRIGPKSGGDLDFRKIWHPPMIVNGHQIHGVPFDAWHTTWPNDGSDLSGKSIDVYLPQHPQMYLSYFPYWLQITGTVGKAKIRIIDSGKQLVSPKASLPRRPPEFLDGGRLVGDKLIFSVKTYPYYRSFTLTAAEDKLSGKATKALGADEKVSVYYQLPFTIQPSNDPQVVFITLDLQEMRSQLSPGSYYYLFLQPVGFPKIFAQTKDPLLVK